MSTATASAAAPLPLDDDQSSEPIQRPPTNAETTRVDGRKGDGGGAHDRRTRRKPPADLDDLLDSGNYSAIARNADPPLSTSHVSRVLRGYSRPSLDVARRIARSAGVTLDDLQPWLERRQASPVQSTRRQSSKPVANPNAKLDIDLARELRVRMEEGESRNDLIEELAERGINITKQAMSDVARGLSYPVGS